MNYKVSLFLLIMITIIFGNSIRAAEISIVKQTKVNKLSLQISSRNLQEDNPILSDDPVIARKALKKAIQEKDKNTLRLGLTKQFSFLLLNDVIDAIQQFRDKSFVPNLTDALARNQVDMVGGTETLIEQALLSRKLITVIGELTGLKFELPTLPSPNSVEKFEPLNYVTPTTIKKALEESREWWSVHKNKFI